MDAERRKEIWKQFDNDYWGTEDHIGKYGDFIIDLTEKAKETEFEIRYDETNKIWNKYIEGLMAEQKARTEKAFDDREKELLGDEIWLHGPTQEQIMNERGHRVDELRILKRKILEGI